MEEWDNIITLLMILSGGLIIGVNILIWKFVGKEYFVPWFKKK